MHANKHIQSLRLIVLKSSLVGLSSSEEFLYLSYVTYFFDDEQEGNISHSFDSDTSCSSRNWDGSRGSLVLIATAKTPTTTSTSPNTVNETAVKVHA